MFSLSHAEESSWNVVILECESLSANWKQLSGYLGLSNSVIETIQHDNPKKASNCWNEALSKWIKQNYNTKQFGLPSWRTLLKAIAVVNFGLFKTLASQHQGNNEYFLYCAGGTQRTIRFTLSCKHVSGQNFPHY